MIDPADVRWIWLTHPDRDHTGGILALLEAAPQARLVTTFAGFGIFGCQYAVPMDRVYLLNPGQDLDVGDRMLSCFRPALFDSPVTTGFLDRKTGALFSSDCFGAPLPTPDLAGPRIGGVGAGRRPPGGPAAVGERRQPVGARRGPQPVAGPGRRDALDGAVRDLQHPPAAGGRRTRRAAGTPCSRPRTARQFVGPDQAALEAMLASFEPA